MRTIINDTIEQPKSINWDDLGKGGNDIDDLLKEYDNAELTISKDPDPIPPTGNPQPQPIQQAQQQPTNLGPDDPSNPVYYYQSGKKKGQRRPNPKVKASYNPPPNQQVTISGQFITGALFLLLIDMLVPLLIGLLNDRFGKTSIDVKKLKLTPEQKRELEPVCDAVVKYINFTANPVILLLISLSGIYGLNFMALKQMAKIEQAKDKQKNKENENTN